MTERSGCKLDHEKSFAHKFQSAALQEGLSEAWHSGILGFAFNGDDDDDLWQHVCYDHLP